MFVIGDLIFMPVFGAGCIVNIEDRRVHGEVSRYYIINFVLNNISIMLPLCSGEVQKIRRVISLEEYEEVVNILCNSLIEMPVRWNERQKFYNTAIREGDIFLLSTILKRLSDCDKEKKLSKSEYKIYKEILGLIASEISIVLGRDFNTVRSELDDFLKKRK